MKMLTRIGYSGEKAMIGVEYDCESHEIRLIRTQFKQGKLFIEESKGFQDEQNLQAYLVQWPALPILLRIKHAGEIEKWIPTETENKIKAILGVSVDNPQDFIYEEIYDDSGKHLLSLIRKEVFLQAWEIFGAHKDRLIGLYLSEASACFLLPASPNYSAEIPVRLQGTKDYTWKGALSKEDNFVESLRQEELARELDIAPHDLCLYASILLFYLGERQQVSGIPALISNRQKLGKFHKMSKTLSLSLALISCMLLLSFLGLSWFSYQEQQSSQFIQTQSSTLERIHTHKTRLAEKQEFLSTSREKSLAPSKIAWYIDQLSAIAPKEVGFERILFKGKTKQLKKIDVELEARKFDLLIQGASRNAHALSTFSSTLAEKPWVQEAEIFSSQYDYRAQHLQFILLVSLSHGKVH